MPGTEFTSSLHMHRWQGVVRQEQMLLLIRMLKNFACRRGAGLHAIWSIGMNETFIKVLQLAHGARGEVICFVHFAHLLPMNIGGVAKVVKFYRQWATVNCLKGFPHCPLPFICMNHQRNGHKARLVVKGPLKRAFSTIISL